jgi:hypothetical protein
MLPMSPEWTHIEWRPQGLRPLYACFSFAEPSQESQRAGPPLGLFKLGDREYDLRNRFRALQALVFK